GAKLASKKSKATMRGNADFLNAFMAWPRRWARSPAAWPAIRRLRGNAELPPAPVARGAGRWPGRWRRAFWPPGGGWGRQREDPAQGAPGQPRRRRRFHAVVRARRAAPARR